MNNWRLAAISFSAFALGAELVACGKGKAESAAVLPHRCSPDTLPDPVCTPGKTDPAKTKEVLCAPGYTTRSVRPNNAFTMALKIRQMRQWGLPGTPAEYEEDHLIPLELGGDPVSSDNLWPERYLPRPGAHEKDKVESYLHRAVCEGRIELAVAQGLIAKDWLKLLPLTAPPQRRPAPNVP